MNEKSPSSEGFKASKSSDNLTQGSKPVNRVSAKHGLLRSAGVMGALILLSRILGMIRDMISAKYFGTSWQWDGFIYAFMIPNFFRRLVADGALSSAFIPVYSETLETKGSQAAFHYANTVETFLICLFLIFLPVVEIGLSAAVAFLPLSETVHLALDLMRVFFPFLGVMSLFAFHMGILNSHKHFFAPALGTSVINLFWIGAVFTAHWISSDVITQLRWLAWMILISGVAELFVEAGPLHKIGYKIKWVFDFKSVELKKTFSLITPVILGFAVLQVNILVDMTVGLALGSGANSSLWYGNRLMQLPLGMFAVAMGTALLPSLSEQVARHDMEEAKSTLSFALRSVFLIVLPATAGLIVLRTPIIELLFERGAFDAESTRRTAQVLAAYSIGLFAFSGQKIVASAFYAIQDTKTPVKVAIWALFINIVFNLLLMFSLRETGLALATSISGTFNFLMLFYFLQKKVMAVDFKPVLSAFSKMLLAAALMGIFAHMFYEFLKTSYPEDHVLIQTGCLFGAITVSIGIYIVACYFLRVREMKKAVEWLLPRRFAKK